MSQPLPQSVPVPPLPLLAAGQPYLPAVYQFAGSAPREPLAEALPQVAHIELARRLPAGDAFLTLAGFTRIVSQLPDVRRAVLTGSGATLLAPDLTEMIGLLKLRDVYVILDAAGAALAPSQAADLVRSGLDELRFAVAGARAETCARLAGDPHALPDVVAAAQAVRAARARLASHSPRLALRCALRRENLAELPGLVRLAARLGLAELYVERLVYPPGSSLAAAAVFGRPVPYLEEMLSECEALAVESGVALRAAGGRDPRNSLAAASGPAAVPWHACLRPWTSLYVTTAGDCLPCRVAAQVAPGQALGNLLRGPLSAIWNAEPYLAFRQALSGGEPGLPCAGCGVNWSL